MTCRGSNGVGGEGGASGAEISGAGNGRSGDWVGNGKVAGAGVSSGKSGEAVVIEVGVGSRMGGRLVG